MELILILFAIFICWLTIKWYNFVKKYEKLPGPKPRWPFIGNLDLLLSKKGSITKRMNELFEEMYVRHKDEGMFLFLLGSNAVLFVHDPQLVEELLKDRSLIYKPIEYSYFVPWLGNGLTTAGGDKWKAKRKLLNPTFHSDVLNYYIPIINDEISKMMKIIQSKVQLDYFDIRKLISNLVMDIVSSSALGVPLGMQTKENNKYAVCSSRTVRNAFERIYNPLLWSDFMFYKTKIGKQFQEDVMYMKNLAMNMIQRRKAKFFEDNNYEAKRMAFLDHLISLQRKDNSIDDQFILEEVSTFILGGNESISIVLSWTILLIGQHQKVQNKVIEELDSIFGHDEQREITGEDLSKMIYLECVIKEAMRVYTPTPVFGRLVPNDLKIKGVTIPKGTIVRINVLKLHQNEKVFPNHKEFQPERFLYQDTSKFKSSYMPFGAGLRDCIGKRFAMIEMKLVLAHIFRKYAIGSIKEENTRDKVFDITFRPQGEIRIKLIPRSSDF